MNLNMKKYLIVLGAIATIGCSKEYLDVNDNPNTPTTTRADYVFTNAIVRTTAYQSGAMHALGANWTGHWGHSTSFTGGGQQKTYVFTNSDFNFFDGAYDNLYDYQYVIEHADADGYGFLVGPAKVMQALVFQKLVDLYGNVPYSQALKGQEFILPVYDNAQAIYEDLIVKLNEAISDINAATWPTSAPSDLVFKGNKTNWIKFANTLKLRIAMRQSFMPGRDAYIQGVINGVSADGYITDNVYANPGFLKSPGKINIYYGNWGYNENDVETGYRFNKFGHVITAWMKTSNDLFRLQRLSYPRVGGNPNNLSDYVGVPLGGAGNSYLETLVSSIGSEMIVKGDATRPMIIMSASEAFFLKAEAAQRYGIASLGTAQSNYESGITWAFRLAAATHVGTATATNAQADAAAAAYYAQAVDNVNWTASTNKIKAILIQKWMVLGNIDGSEAWAEYRKSSGSTSVGVPASVKSVAVAASQPEPVRLFYPLRENSVNGSNVPTGIDVFTSKVFWDVN